MDLYSTLLLLAIAATALSLATTMVGRIRQPTVPLGDATRAMTILAVATSGAALIYHVAFEHRPSTADALAPGAFVREHPVLIITLVASLLTVWLGRTARQDNH